MCKVYSFSLSLVALSLAAFSVAVAQSSDFLESEVIVSPTAIFVENEGERGDRSFDNTVLHENTLEDATLDTLIQRSQGQDTQAFTIEDLLKTERAAIEKKPFKALFSIRSKRTNHGESFVLTDTENTFENNRYIIQAEQCLRDYEGIDENDVVFLRVYSVHDMEEAQNTLDKNILKTPDVDASSVKQVASEPAAVDARVSESGLLNTQNDEPLVVKMENSALLETLEPVFKGWLYRLHPSVSTFVSTTHQLSFKGCRQK